MRCDSQKVGAACAFPFFAWQCITLQISGRSVDLVIKDDHDMNVFLRFLVQALNTMDGYVNSAQFYIEASVLNEVARREKALNKKILARRKTVRLKGDEEYDGPLRLLTLPQEEKDQIMEEKRREVNRQTMFKFSLMRVRSKISYYAFRRRMPVHELMLR